MNLPDILAQASYYYRNDFYAASPGMYSSMTLLGAGILLLVMLLGGAVQMGLKNAFNRYAREQAPLTGAEVARLMLNQNGLGDVQVISTPGRLTDHYNPMDRTVNLSESVYN